MDRPNWKAHWIWQKDAPSKPNTYVYFRRGVILKDKPSKAMCHASADTNYNLFINGSFVGRGPILTEPRWQSYDTYDVSNLLRAGANVIGAIVYHYGNAIDNPDGYTFNWSRGGFLCQIDMENGGRTAESIITDSSWEVLESSAWHRNLQKLDDMTYAEIYDARKEPEGWLEPEFSDKNWVPATVVTGYEINQWTRNSTPSKGLPWTQLEPRSIPYFKYEEITPKAIINSGEVLELAEPNSSDAGTVFDAAIRMSLEDVLPFKHTSILNIESLLGNSSGLAVINPMDDNISYDDYAGVYDPTITLDTGKLINGRAFFDIEAAPGSIIEIGYGQILVNGRVVPYLSHRTQMADQYITKEGRQCFQTFTWRHFRYIQLTFRNMQKPIKIHRIRMVSESYPAERAGTFQCSDEMLNWIWQACIDTTLLCTHDRFMDNPMRERREYTLDVANILHGIWAGFGDVAIIKKYFNDVRRGQLPYRVLPSCILGAKREGNRVLVDGGTFVLRLWEYYEFSGNRVALEEMFEPAYSFIKHLEEYSDDNGLIGKLPYPVFIDWSDIDFRGSSLCINAIFTQAMKTLSDMADVLGMSDISDEYGKKFQKLCGLISGLFWDAKRGIFVDALIDGVKSEHVSEHGNYLMILFGFASAPQTKSIIEFLREPSNEIGRLEPLFYWASEALFKARESALALNMMRGRYGRIRKQGLDTISELWSLRGERFTGSWRSRDSRSACQSGGVSAAYLLSKYILGISPLKPGFEEVLISPQPCDLTWARGTFPSPKGPIRVKWERDDEKFALECKLPDELPVKIKLPHYLPALRSITVNGETMPYEEY